MLAAGLQGAVPQPLGEPTTATSLHRPKTLEAKVIADAVGGRAKSGDLIVLVQLIRECVGIEERQRLRRIANKPLRRLDTYRACLGKRLCV